MAVEGWGQQKEAEAWRSKGWRVRLGGWGLGVRLGGPGIRGWELRFGGPRCVNPESGFFGPIPLPRVPGKAAQEGDSKVQSLPRPEVWALLGKLGP